MIEGHLKGQIIIERGVIEKEFALALEGLERLEVKSHVSVPLARRFAFGYQVVAVEVELLPVNGEDAGRLVGIHWVNLSVRSEEFIPLAAIDAAFVQRRLVDDVHIVTVGYVSFLLWHFKLVDQIQTIVQKTYSPCIGPDNNISVAHYVDVSRCVRTICGSPPDVFGAGDECLVVLLHDVVVAKDAHLVDCCSLCRFFVLLVCFLVEWGGDALQRLAVVKSQV